MEDVDQCCAECFRSNNQNGTEELLLLLLLCFLSSKPLLAFIIFPFEFKQFWKKSFKKLIARLCNNTIVVEGLLNIPL